MILIRAGGFLVLERRANIMRQVKKIPKGLFGYRVDEVDQEMETLAAQEQDAWRLWAERDRELAIDTARAYERTKTLESLINQLQMECERLKIQVERERIHGKYAEDGARYEVNELKRVHNESMRTLRSTIEALDTQIAHYEDETWAVVEHLTRVMQETQTVADRELTQTTHESLWQEVSRTLLGEQPSDGSTVTRHKDVLRYGFLANTVTVATREGKPLGYLSSLVLAMAVPQILGYEVVSPDRGSGVIPAEDVHALRYKHIMVRSHPRWLAMTELPRPNRAPLRVDRPIDNEAGDVTDRESSVVLRNDVVAANPELAQDRATGSWSEAKDDMVEAHGVEISSPSIGMDSMPTPELSKDTPQEHGDPHGAPPWEPESSIPVNPKTAEDTVGDTPRSQEQARTPDMRSRPLSDPGLEEITDTATPLETAGEEVSSGFAESLSLTHRFTESADAPPNISELQSVKESASDSTRQEGHAVDVEPVTMGDDSGSPSDPIWGKPSGSDELFEETPPTLSLPGVMEANAPTLLDGERSKPAGINHSLDRDAEDLPGLAAGNRSGLADHPTWTSGGPPIARASRNIPQIHEVGVGEPSGMEEGEEPVESMAMPMAGAIDVRTFLYGKKVGQAVVDSHGNVLAQQGEPITEEMVRRVESAGLLPELIVHMVF